VATPRADAALRTARATDGTILRYELAGPPPGDRPAVVLLHGSLANHYAFRKVRPAFEPDRRVVATVLRGHEGDEPVVPADYSLAGTELDDVLAILDTEGLGRVDLVAHSTGGSVAIALAARHPERVGRLVLIEPTLLPLLDGAVGERVHADCTAMLAAADRGEQLGALRAMLDFVGGRAWFSSAESARQKIVDALAPLAPLVRPHIAALAGLAVRETDITALAAAALFVYGRDSAFFELPTAKLLHRLRPDLAQLHVEGAGHNVHLDAPELVGAAIARFLGTGALNR